MKKVCNSLRVVILTYNSARTIERCLNPLVKQENKDFDVLIVDDDSTDNTLELVGNFKKKLSLSTIRNGSHIIAKGRNIGLRSVASGVVAFLDSDDSAAPSWTKKIKEPSDLDPQLAAISGALVPSIEGYTAKAIATNDEAIRDIFWKGTMLFGAGNCAINRNIKPHFYFNESFVYAEDLELARRIMSSGKWRYVEDMKINYKSRATFAQYAKQMFRYGKWKLFFSFRAKEYRAIDFAPLGLIVLGFGVAAATGLWLMAMVILAFSALEAIFVAGYKRCSIRTSLLLFPAWVVKNIAWSVGIAVGLIELSCDGNLRKRLTDK